METRRSSKRKEREEAPPNIIQQAPRKSKRVTKPSPAAQNREATELASLGNTQQAAQAREIEPANSPSGGPATRLRSKRAAAAALQPPATTTTRARRARAKAREPSSEPEDGQQPKEVVEVALPQAAPSTVQPATVPVPTVAEAEKPSSGARRLTPLQLREMANRQGRGQSMDDEKDLAEVFGRNFSGAGSALQGLLRKLGAGFDDMMPMGGVSGSRMKAIMQGLRQVEDEVAQLSALSELNDLLSISSEDNVAAFPTESMVPLLIQLLNAEHSPDIMLMAARVLTFLADVLPQSCGAIVRHGAVPAFCARLLNIEYIDLAEQSLQALEKLSHEHSSFLLQNGGLLAVLSYLDFFPTSVQRTATATAANICRSLAVSPSTASSPAANSAVKEAIPILTGLLHYADAKVVDNACISLSYIAEASAGQATLLEALTSGGLVGQALQLVGLSESGAMTSQLSLSTYYGLLKLIATAAASSASVAIALLGAGALATARTLLATSPLFMTGPGGGGGAAAMLRTPDQLHEVLGVLTELLPPVPDSQTLMSSGAAVELPQIDAAASAFTSAAPSSDGGRQGAAARGVELLSYLAANPSLASTLCNEMLSLVLSSYSATVISGVRARALKVILQILVACPAALLLEALRDLPLAAFLCSLLATRDAATLAAALHCCEVLMAKLPDVFRHAFLKEGVAHAIEQIASSVSATQAAVGSPPPPPALISPPNPARGGLAASTDEPRRVTRSSLLAAAAREDKAPSPSTAANAGSGAAIKATAAPSTATATTGTASAPSATAGASRAPPSSPGATSLRAALAARALQFKRTHYGTGCGAPETEGLVRVRSLLQQLPSEPTATLSKLLMVMAASNASANAAMVSSTPEATAAISVSVFELLNSGAVKVLYDYFTGADFPATTTLAEAEDRTTTILRRIAALTRAGLTPAEGYPCNPPLMGLVRKLQAALSSMETFPVHYGRAVPPSSSGSFRSGGGIGGYANRNASAGSASAMNPGSLSSGLSMLTHPFKLRLCRHGNDNTLRDYSSNIVLIEPLATMTAIEEFLWPRVYRGGGAASQLQQGMAAGTTGTAAAAGSGGATAPSEAPTGAAVGSGKGTTTTVAAATGASGGGRSATAVPAAPSRSYAIPVDDIGASNRRVTRSQAARERAEAEEASRQRAALPVPSRGGSRHGGNTATGEGKDDTLGSSPGAAAAAAGVGGELAARDHRMTDVGNDAEEDDEARRLGRRRSRGRHGSEPEMDDDEEEESPDGDAEMDDTGAAGDAMFDEDDEDFDDGMDGDDGDGAIGNLHVHDLHVDQDPSATALGRALQPAGGSTPSQQPAAGGATVSHQGGSSAVAGAAAAAALGHVSGAWASRSAAATAAAAAAGGIGTGTVGHGSGTGATSGRSAAHEASAPKLAFCMGSDESPLLSTGCTVFQAIQQTNNRQQASAEGEEDGEEEPGQRRGRRLWDEVHTLYYRTSTPTDSTAETSAVHTGSSREAGSGLATTAAGSSGLGRWGSTPLRELIEPRVPVDLSCTATCREVLALLALLEAVNRLGPRACAELDAVGAGGPEEDSAGPLESTRHVLRDEFVSAKLSSKLGQQLKDVLSICGGSMPNWCSALAAPCRFLFPFEIRKRYFYCTAFGLGRALQHMQQLHTAEAGGAHGAGHGGADRDGRELRVGRLQRQKVRVSRKRILESAAKVMELYARSRAVLELEYFGEVGTGLGPTLEFFTLLSHELQRKDLVMWRHEEQDDSQKEQREVEGQEAADVMKDGEGYNDKGSASATLSLDKMEVDAGVGAQPAPMMLQARVSGPVTAAPGVSVPSRRGEAATHEECEYVNAPWGLFPKPLPPAMRSGPIGQKVVEQFRLLGRTLAKALQDNRLLDLPLSHVFYAAALGSPLDLWDISRFDPGLGATLAKLHSALVAHRVGGGAGPLLIDGVPIEDLCITYVLPGQPDYALQPGGADVVLSTAEQLSDYIEAVVDGTLGSGIAPQIAAFRDGFSEVFNLSTLSLFHEDEIEVLLCGSGERWTLQVLAEAIKFDHGYTASSQPVRYLLEILSDLDAADQRSFLRFVTGCPRLPPGGLTALNPRLTVVRKHPSGGDGPSNGPTPVGSLQDGGLAAICAADADLPSVMTCANYIKLPPYSSKAVMAARLMYALREGQGSFDLS